MGLTEAIILLSASSLFTVLSFLVLRKGRNYINLTFLTANFLFIISTVFFALNHLFDEVILWGVGYFLFILAPIFWFYSAYFIINGFDHWKDRSPVIIVIVFLILASVVGYMLSVTGDLTYAIVGDVFVGLGSIVALIYYYKVYGLIAEQCPRVKFMLLGFSLGIFGLITNALYFVITGESTIIRQLFPTIGVVLVIITFSSISEELEN